MNTCFVIARSFQLGAWSSDRVIYHELPLFGKHLYTQLTVQHVYSISLSVSWGELTSSKLLAPSYGEAGTRTLTTNH